MGTRMTSAAWVLLLALTAAGNAADAGELWVSDDEVFAWEGGGFIKSQALGMDFRDMTLYPADSATMQTMKARLGTDLYWNDIRIGAEYEFRFTATTSGLEDGKAIAGFGSTQSDRPRLWDLDSISEQGTTLEHDVDRLFIYVPVGPVDLRLGRQVISWGSAWFWKPTDRFSPFSPMDVDPDVKRGVDAVRAEIFLGQRTSLALVATFERHKDLDRKLWVHGGARFRTTIGRYDLAASAARFQLTNEAIWMGGLEFTGELGKVGFRGEGAFNYYEEAGDWDIEGVLGLDYHFPFGLTLAGEAFYNGPGTDDTTQYARYFVGAPSETSDADVDEARAERLARGEAFNVGRYYAGISASQEILPILHASVSAIGNLGDPSAMLMAGLRWSVVQNARFSFGAVIPLGEKPHVPFNLGFPVPQIKSEFGTMPIIAYGVLKLAF